MGVVKPEQKEVLLQGIRLGLNVTDACIRAKVSREYYYDHLKNDEDFAAQIQQAMNDFKTRNLAIINKAAAKTWPAAAWLLERKHPDEYGRNQKAPPVEVKINVADLVAKARKARGLK